MPSFKINSAGFYTFVFFLLTSLAIQSFAQTGVVTGKVRDAATAEPLPFANVFINQTTIGTATDAQGNYTLKNVPMGTNEIVFSFVGYKSYPSKILIKEEETKQLDIRLQSDDLQLETVEVKGTRDKEWDKQLKKFEKVFLGTTRFAGSTKILNAWVLDFKETEINGKDVFTATASKPLEIENQALGYRMFYYLKSMASNAEGHNITGEVRFEEITTPDSKTEKVWNQNRMDAYNGSFRHLIKSIIAGNAQEQGFNLYTDKSGYENTPYRSAVFSTQLDKSIQVFSTRNSVMPGVNKDEFTIPMKQRVEVHYTQKRSQMKVYSDITYPVSWLQVSGGVIKANSKGILLNPANVVVSGAMYEARVADLLPYNYSPGQTQVVQVKALDTPLARKMSRLEEKAYVQTDKPYYYPGEKIWFKAYMNYRTPELMDSLSRVLYVELIDPDEKIKQTKIVLIDGGAGDGSFTLPDAMGTGNYYLRAYTQWMLNYGSEKFFVRSIPVLGLYERPAITSANEITEPTTSQIKLRMDKTSFQPHEKIDLDFELRDQDGSPLFADLSVSVTDMQQVVNVKEVKNILNSFVFSQEDEKGFSTEVKYPIEFGISLNGQYKNKKDLPSKANFMMVVGGSNKLLPIQSDEKGNFIVSKLQFYDSAEMAFQTVGKNKKFEGKVTLQNREAPTTEKLNPEIAFNTMKVEAVQRVRLSDNISEETMIQEISVMQEVSTEDNPLYKENVPKVYSKADFSFSGEEMMKSSRTSLLSALKGRVPGFIILNGYIRLGGPSSFMGSAASEPMVILDGVQITSGGTERLNQINPEIVERVDVIKYGGGAIYGSRGSNGVILVTTKSGVDGVNGQSLADFAQHIKVLGYSSPSTFWVPDYSKVKANNEQPDNRSTLYWSPQVITDKIGNASVTFYASDISTRYKIVVEGVSAAGDPLRGVFFIDVVK